MKLSEAIHDMKPGDQFKPKSAAYCVMSMNSAKVLLNPGGNRIGFSVENMEIEGEIIRAEPEVLTVNEIYDRWASNPHDFRSLDAIREAYQNGQNKEYKRLKPLTDAIRVLHEKCVRNSLSSITEKVLKEYEKLQPPWETE